MFAEADQTAGLNSLNNLRKPTGTLGITKRKGWLVRHGSLVEVNISIYW